MLVAMPFDFDDEQMSSELPPEPTVKTVNVVAAPKPKPPEAPKPMRTPTPVFDEADEMEAKMAKMMYYRDVMNNVIFPDTDDPLAIEVEQEIQSFCQVRLREIMYSGTKKRGRKPAPVTVFENKGRRATTRASEGRGGGLRDAARPLVRGGTNNQALAKAEPVAIAPTGTEMTGVEVVQEVTDPNGFKMQRTYRQVLDKASGRNYYLCYVKGSADTTEAGDGNKYELTANANGGQFFRVVSEQTLPQGMASVKPMTLQDITAASEAHANATMSAIRNSKNNLLAAAISTALKE